MIVSKKTKGVADSWELKGKDDGEMIQKSSSTYDNQLQ